jgi:hypothetical protein
MIIEIRNRRYRVTIERFRQLQRNNSRILAACRLYVF